MQLEAIGSFSSQMMRYTLIILLEWTTTRRQIKRYFRGKCSWWDRELPVKGMMRWVGCTLICKMLIQMMRTWWWPRKCKKKSWKEPGKWKNNWGLNSKFKWSRGGIWAMADVPVVLALAWREVRCTEWTKRNMSSMNCNNNSNKSKPWSSGSNPKIHRGQRIMKMRRIIGRR